MFSLSMKAYREIRSTAPSIFNLDARWRSMIDFTTQPLYPRETNSVPTEQ